MKTAYLLLPFFCLLVLSSCSDKPSLESYIANHQNSEEFITLDVPAGLLIQDSNMDSIPEEARNALKTLVKANVLAMPIKGGNREKVHAETAKMEKILQAKKYKRLINLNVKGKMLYLIYTGDKTDIKNLIIFGKDPDKGFGLARLLGDGMNAQALTSVLKAAEKNKLNFNDSAVSEFMSGFKEEMEETEAE